MKYKKIFMTIISFALIASCFVVFNNANNSNTKTAYENVGKKTKDISLLEDNSVIAIIDNIEISKKDYKKIKANSELLNFSITDNELFDDLIKQKSLYSLAKKHNVSVSEAEVNNSISEARKILKNDIESSELLESYVKSLGISESEYWDTIKPYYKEALITSKYKNEILLNQFYDETSTNKLSSDIQINKSSTNEFNLNSQSNKSYEKLNKDFETYVDEFIDTNIANNTIKVQIFEENR